MAILLTLLLFVFEISFLPKYRVNYYDCIIKGVSTMFPGTYVPRYRCSPNLCSPVPMFPGTYVPRYRCSPVPMFPDLLQMCCRAYVRRPSDNEKPNKWTAKRNISPNIKHNRKRNKS